MIILKTKDGAEVRAHEYKLEPKSKFATGTVKIDGSDVAVKVTCEKHAKFPAYTYATLEGQLYYAKGDLRNTELVWKGAPAPAQEAAPAEPTKKSGRK